MTRPAAIPSSAPGHFPLPGDHDPVGPMRTAEHQRRQGGAGAREAQFIAIEKRQVRLLAH